MAVAMTKKALVVDMYSTSFTQALIRAGTSAQPGWITKPNDKVFDLPKMIEGGLDIVGANMSNGFEIIEGLHNDGSGGGGWRQCPPGCYCY